MKGIIYRTYVVIIYFLMALLIISNLILIPVLYIITGDEAYFFRLADKLLRTLK